MAVLWNPDRRIFVTHIPKCGGTSVMKALARRGFQAYFNSTGHIRVHDIYRVLKIDPNSVEQYIAVLRNPYERELSHWLFEIERFHELNSICNRYRFAVQHKSVNTYVTDPLAKFAWYYEQDWYPHLYPTRPRNLAEYVIEKEVYRYWLTLDDEVPDNMRFVRLENINAELGEVLGEKVDVERLNTTEHGDWRSYYDNRGIAAVNKIYWWTFDKFYDRNGTPKDFESWTSTSLSASAQ